jgi:thymidylate synthase
MNKNIGFIFEGKTPSDVLKDVQETIQTHGTTVQTQRGIVKSIRGATFIINDISNEKKNYPYWDKQSDDWYQDNFVRKETTLAPEIIKSGQDIYPYKYAWRSRYYDSGFGYVVAVIKVLKKLRIKNLRITNQGQLIDLLKQSYQLIHPEVVLAVLSWKGLKLLNFYLENPKILALELQSQRRDTLESVIEEVKQSPSTRRAIMPSFTYEHIDHSGAAGGVPVYQNYQLYVNFDERSSSSNKKGNPESITSYHLHRAIDAFGGAQLDINHDKEWGLYASKKLKLPLQKIVIYVNDVWASFDKDMQHLSKKTDIRSWLFSVTDAYDPKVEDIDKRISSALYQKKIEYTLKNLNN